MVPWILPPTGLSGRAFQRSVPTRFWAAATEGNMEIMTKATESVLADALRLNVKARAELAAELLASLDGPADPDAATAWEKESSVGVYRRRPLVRKATSGIGRGIP
jgi:hypothetical protein